MQSNPATYVTFNNMYKVMASDKFQIMYQHRLPQKRQQRGKTIVSKPPGFPSSLSACKELRHFKQIMKD